MIPDSQIKLVQGPGHSHRPVIQGSSLRDFARLPLDIRTAVFLDRDGVLVEDVNYLCRPAQLNILPNVLAALKLLQNEYQLIVVTNQSGVARGFFTEEDLLDVHTALADWFWAGGVVVDGFYYCPHLENASVAAYNIDCICRKPRPGMVLQAINDFGVALGRSFLIGDRPSDMETANAAGVIGIHVSSGVTASSMDQNQTLDHHPSFDGLFEAAQYIVSLGEPTPDIQNPPGQQSQPNRRAH